MAMMTLDELDGFFMLDETLVFELIVNAAGENRAVDVARNRLYDKKIKNYTEEDLVACVRRIREQCR